MCVQNHTSAVLGDTVPDGCWVGACQLTGL
jgi:hypothetical protein